MIAAGVLAASAAALGGIVRLNIETTAKSEARDNVNLISVRLKAGMSDEDALAGLDGWTLERRPYLSDLEATDSPPFEVVTVQYDSDDSIAFDILAPVGDVTR